jgi:phage baseplate assembly protein V
MVYYADRDLQSDWLPVRQKGSGLAIWHYCPRVGDNVTVEHRGTGIEQGVVTGAYPTDNNPAITPNSLDSIALSSHDGAFFEHEPNSGTFTVAGVGTMHLSVNGETLMFSGPWTLQSSGTVQITASGTATVKAPTIVLDAVDVKVTGKLWVDQMKPFSLSEIISNPHVKNVDGSGNGS